MTAIQSTFARFDYSGAGRMLNNADIGKAVVRVRPYYPRFGS